jgi:RNA polymerase sigma-70 factor, ECF subfamily
MRRLQAGDQTAAFEIFEEYSGRLAGLARTRVNGALAAKLDPEDVVQSVFRSFFQRQREGQFKLDGWNNLWSLLTVITLRKCSRQVEYFRAACRNVQQEAQASPDESEAYAACVAIARDPSPDETSQLLEAIELILADFTGRDRLIVEMTLQGEPCDSVSQQVQCSERTVERVRARLLSKLKRMID